jgi:hypothetical protein
MKIYDLKLPVELVMLSACSTGLGKEVRGEGLVGMAGGFMDAGWPGVIASLWKVDDRATSELMAKFYQLTLKNNLRPPARFVPPKWNYSANLDGARHSTGPGLSLKGVEVMRLGVLNSANKKLPHFT